MTTTDTDVASAPASQRDAPLSGLRSDEGATREDSGLRRPGGERGKQSERESRAWAALATVRDPELDEPITTLGFVASCTVSADGRARVRLRLPTYFCAPNFAFLMVADAYDAVAGTPGVRSAEVVLDDHFAADAINAGVAARAGFVASFDGEAVAELHELRAAFLRKAVMAGTDLVCRPLLAAGATPERLRQMALGDVPPSAELTRLRQRRGELGLPADDAAPLLIDPVTGERVDAGTAPLHLRRARLTRTGIEANTSICSGMLRHRYLQDPAGAPDAVSGGSPPGGSGTGPPGYGGRAAPHTGVPGVAPRANRAGGVPRGAVPPGEIQEVP